MSSKVNSVYLQSFDMVDDSNFCGVVHVECRGPVIDRKVFVRVTSNRWKDYTDIPARLMKANSDAELRVYCFQFSRSNKRIKHVELAVCCEEQGEKIWDDNDRRYYKFENIPDKMPHGITINDVTDIPRSFDLFLEILEESIRECTINMKNVD